MGVRKDKKTDKWIAEVCRRHPITKKPVTKRKKGFDSKLQATRAAEDLIEQIKNEFKGVKTPLWPDYLDRYFEDIKLKDYTKKSLIDMEKCLRKATEKKWRTKFIDQIGAGDIREIIKVDFDGKSPSHKKSTLKFIKGAFTHAVEIGLLSANPTPQMKIKVGNKLTAVLTEQQAKKLLKLAKAEDSFWYPHWSFALHTGCRNGELYALTWDKVDLENRKIIIDCAWNSKDGFKSTKSGDDRQIEIATPLVPLLKALKSSNHDPKFVLPRSRRWDKGEQARELRFFLKANGLPRIRFHDLRATWATILLDKGKPPFRVMKMGGWKDIKTMDRYLRLAGIDIKGLTDGFELE